MKLLNQLKKYPPEAIVSVANATFVPIETIKDPAFSQEMMGQTIAFQLKDGTIVSPCNGTLEVLYPTGHAFAIKSNQGFSIMVHIGINTVDLNGRGFKVFAKQGQKVKANQKIVEVDLELFKKEGYQPIVMLIIIETLSNERISFNINNEVKQGQILNK
ncbi:MAG: PTS glucose transporter subunit IIA [Traorella sp.]